jgi:D-alanyl-D-alanine carboxypeptidase
MKKILLTILLALGIVIIGSILFVLPVRQESSTTSEQEASTSQQQTSQQPASQADVPTEANATDWELVLVNRNHPLEQELTFDQTTIDGKIVDARIAQAVQDFRQGAADAGYPTTLVSGYRSIHDQQAVYDQSMANYLAAGQSQQEAQRLTESVIALPKASEHHTGLAIDVAGNDALSRYPELRAEMDEFASQQWLIAHAPDYGFILRYPKAADKIRETGINYESWHFRYVGQENAQYMTENDLTLEAYIEQLKTKNE